MRGADRQLFMCFRGATKVLYDILTHTLHAASLLRMVVAAALSLAVDSRHLHQNTGRLLLPVTPSCAEPLAFKSRTPLEPHRPAQMAASGGNCRGVGVS